MKTRHRTPIALAERQSRMAGARLLEILKKTGDARTAPAQQRLACADLVQTTSRRCHIRHSRFDGVRKIVVQQVHKAVEVGRGEGSADRARASELSLAERRAWAARVEQRVCARGFAAEIG